MALPAERRAALRVLGLLVVAGSLAGCTPPSRFNIVDDAKIRLIGLSEQDITMCAGFPDRREEKEEVRIWSYRHDTDGGNLAVSAPVLAGLANTSVNYSSGGDCSVQFLFVQGRVRRIAYSGDNDTTTGRDMLCAPVIDDCLRYVAETERGPAPQQQPQPMPQQAAEAPARPDDGAKPQAITRPKAPAGSKATTPEPAAKPSPPPAQPVDGAPLRLSRSD